MSYMAVSLALLLLVLLCSPSPTLVVPAAATAEEHEYTFVAISSLKPKASCSGHRVSPPQNRTWAPLSLSHGSCSLSPSSSRRRAKPSMAELLRQDRLRVEDIQMRLSGNADEQESKKKHAAKTVSTIMHYGPVTRVNMGTANSISTQGSPLSIDDPMAAAGRSMPGVAQTVVVDTGSDVPWVQCHPQTDTFYDPTRSRTYAAFPCGSPACARLGAYSNGCINNQCQYRVTYPDGSSTLGTYSSDVLTFDATNAITSFQFGCSQAEQGSSFDAGSSGTMALGGGVESLVSQTAATHGNAFSYCVPPTASDAGFFVLGAPPGNTRNAFVATPTLRNPPGVPTFYRVLLRDVAVGGRRLNVPAAAFAAGAVVDSRTVITRLPPTAYWALRAAFRSRMGMYRPAPPKGILDTCYDFTGVFVVRLPRVALVFDRNAVVELDASGILFNDCLAFAPTSGDRVPGIIGNVQQRTLEVLYDVGGGAVGFRQGAC